MPTVKEIKKAIKKNPLALYLIVLRKRKKYEKYEKRYGDREFIELLYEKAIGKRPSLDAPRTFTEKLQWLKLNYRDPAIPLCSDKYEAKKYIERKGFGNLLIPTLAVYDDADDIDFDGLPNEFILKATHGSGWNVICRDKSKLDRRHVKKTFAAWLKQNLYIYGREWNYKEQTPRIIAEPLMDDKPLVDYKFMCFNGVCRAMQVNHDDGGKHYVDLYNADWELIPDMSTGTAPVFGEPIPKPERFDEMKKIAEELAKPFPFVRVDLYNIRGKIYFGEMTFFPGSGFWHITPEKYDEQFGDMLTLPDKNI